MINPATSSHSSVSGSQTAVVSTNPLDPTPPPTTRVPPTAAIPPAARGSGSGAISSQSLGTGQGEDTIGRIGQPGPAVPAGHDHGALDDGAHRMVERNWERRALLPAVLAGQVDLHQRHRRAPFDETAHQEDPVVESGAGDLGAGVGASANVRHSGATLVAVTKVDGVTAGTDDGVVCSAVHPTDGERGEERRGCCRAESHATTVPAR